jgi:hypothetical protein
VAKEEVRSFFAWAKREKDRTYVHPGYIGLYALLAVLDERWPPGGLLAILERHRQGILEFFGRCTHSLLLIPRGCRLRGRSALGKKTGPKAALFAGWRH